jgi:adenosine kinase
MGKIESAKASSGPPLPPWLEAFLEDAADWAKGRMWIPRAILLAYLVYADIRFLRDPLSSNAERTGLSLEAIAERVSALIETRGGEGSRIYAEGAVIEVPAVPATAVVDPTGCGDAYRAGLLFGIAERWTWERTGRLASLLGSLKIACRGGQNHTVNRDELGALYYSQFRENLW